MKAKRKVKKRTVVVSGFSVFLLLLFVFVLFAWMNFKFVEVVGPSMEPTFYEGDRVLVSKAYWLVGDIKTGDIVVASDSEGVPIIKRVYAKGGEQVDYYTSPEGWKMINGLYVVPDGGYYVVGDNRPESEDSRIFGPLELDQILGKVVVLRSGFKPDEETETP